jgi:hypothetical protein
MKRKTTTDAKRLWDQLCTSVSKKRPLEGMTKEEAIEAIRKVREKLREDKLAARHWFKCIYFRIWPCKSSCLQEAYI